MMSTVAPRALRVYAVIIDLCILLVPSLLAIVLNLINGVALLDTLFLTIIFIVLGITAVSLVVFVLLNKGVTPGYHICGIMIVSTLTGEEITINEYIRYLFTGSFSVVPEIKGVFEVYSLLFGEYGVSHSMKQACVIPVKKRVYNLFLTDYGTEEIKASLEEVIASKPAIL